jgi:putative transposase
VIAVSQPLFPELPLERACQLLGVNRGSYYRHRPEPDPAANAVELRAAIETVVLAFPGYGYRRVTKALQREGWRVNHKRVLRLMREECLLCQLRRRWVRTTDSEHGLTVYPNLLKQAGWRLLTGIDQAWMADLTYIRLPGGFCYLAALLDGYSRKVVGWELLAIGESAHAQEAPSREPSNWVLSRNRRCRCSNAGQPVPTVRPA